MTVENQLFWLRLMHTVIFAVCMVALLVMIVFALTGGWRTAALWSLIAPVTILAGLWLNSGRCVLQTRARKLTGISEGWARDIFFLPESWATRVVRLFVLPFTLAVTGTLLRFALA
ncbi:hypothetical protein [Hyphobacterium sp.]|uniref:hypothetical protein n=1 Tax=Hyphobacterium sp. TaxID=2004662 RepID=UPI003B515927